MQERYWFHPKTQDVYNESGSGSPQYSMQLQSEANRTSPWAGSAQENGAIESSPPFPLHDGPKLDYSPCRLLKHLSLQLLHGYRENDHVQVLCSLAL